MSGFRIQKRFIYTRTNSEFHATYRGHDIQISFERKDPKPFYIMVTAPSGEYAYDGWWGEEWNTMDEAIVEALRGSCLIPRIPTTEF